MPPCDYRDALRARTLGLATGMADIMNRHCKAITGGASVSKHVVNEFADNAELIYVPTGVVAIGHQQIEQLLAEYSRQSHTIQNEMILDQIASNQKVVQESVLNVIHNESISWLLPGVKPTRKEITIPLITILAFNQNGLITSKKVYWDQASVLRQVTVLPKSLYCKASTSECILPICGANIADHLINTLQVQEAMDTQTRESLIGDVSKVSLNEEVLSNSRFNSRRNEPKSSIFEEDESTKAISSSRGGHYDQSKIFSPVSDNVPQISNRRDPNRSSIVDEDPSNTFNRPGHRQFSGRATKSQFSFSAEDDQSDVKPYQSRPSTGTSFSFGDDQAEQPSQVRRRDPNARSEEEKPRSSTRTHAPPGGRSSFSFA